MEPQTIWIDIALNGLEEAEEIFGGEKRSQRCNVIIWVNNDEEEYQDEDGEFMSIEEISKVRKARLFLILNVIWWSPTPAQVIKYLQPPGGGIDESIDLLISESDDLLTGFENESIELHIGALNVEELQRFEGTGLIKYVRYIEVWLRGPPYPIESILHAQEAIKQASKLRRLSIKTERPISKEEREFLDGIPRRVTVVTTKVGPFRWVEDHEQVCESQTIKVTKVDI